MTKVRRFTVVRIFAAAAGVCLAVPASGAVTFQPQLENANWNSSVSAEGLYAPAEYTLSLGENGDSIYQYAITCYLEGCDGLKWGGSLLSASWSADLSNNTLNYNINALEGTDSGTGETDMSIYLLFHTDRKPIFFVSQSASTTPAGPDCVDCQDSFSWSASSQADSSGGYFASIFVFSSATTGYGENLFSHQLHAVVGEAPEPATWTMMLSGFAGMGAALRSRRKRPAAT